MRSVVLWIAALFLAPAALLSQVVLSGVVREDSTGRPLVDTEVSIDALGKVARSDADGHYLLSGLSRGLRVVRVRRVGYSPLSVAVQLRDGENEANLSLQKAPVKLDSVIVSASGNPRMWDFDDNRRLGLGHFWTAAEIEASHAANLPQLLDAVSGGLPKRGTRASAAWFVSRRFEGQAVWPDPFSVKLGAVRDCYATVYVDGVRVYRTHDYEPLFDLNSIPVDEIEGIEYYAGPSETPARYNGLDSNCGVLVIWTQHDPKPKKP